jgi:hypothetical protein
VKILAVIDFKPKTGRVRQKRFVEAMRTKGFLKLPDSGCGWVSDNHYHDVEDAGKAVAEASTTSGARIEKAYVIEYGSFVVIPKAACRR